jgi:hypothetical protein
VTISRRRLIGGAGSLLATGAVFASTSPGQRLLDQLPFLAPTQPLDRTPMAAHLGERFVTDTAEFGRVALTLDAVTDLDAAPTGAEGRFVARFIGPASAPLGQSTYRFATATFGEVDVFVVPGAAGRDPAAMSYTAVFNRLEVVA